MSQEAAREAAPQPAERRFPGSLRSWEFIFLAAFAPSIVLAAVWQGNKEYLNNDELVTAVVVSNPSFTAMWNVIRSGGELNPPLFFIIEWLVAHTLGPHEWALRAVSTLSLVLAGWVMFFTVRPFTGPRAAALGVMSIFGLSREVFGFTFVARYYAMLLLLVCLAVFLAMCFDGQRPLKRRDCVLVFLSHCALVYLHLYGLLYSGVILAGMVTADWLRRQRRWGLYAAIIAAWVAFAAWLPSMRQQLKSASGGVFVPPGMLDVGFFFENLAMATPLAVVFLLVLLLGLLSLVSSPPGRMSDEANSCLAPGGWLSLGLLALALMSVPVGTWMASHFMHPHPYMLRYTFPIIAAWVVIVAMFLLALHRLPRPAARFTTIIKPWHCDLAWALALAFCVIFQPMRARKNPSRPAAPFTDADFGYKNLPMVFENSWPYLQRAWYGSGREYAMVIDHDAAEADRGYYTKLMDRELRAFAPRYGKLVILPYDKLPDWPDGFLAVDDDYTKTFEWLFAHRPELKVQLLGTRTSSPAIFGQERIYLVRKQ